uniref:Putative secreted peptide n=1 Tax=Anopheles braziliensis TaxID=58242 RepID=A0A2M3ZN63_9DIPT
MLCLAFAALAMTACLLLLLLLLMWQIRGRLLLLVTSIATTSGHAVHTGVTSTSRVMADTRRRLLRHAHNYGSPGRKHQDSGPYYRGHQDSRRYHLLSNGYNNSF